MKFKQKACADEQSIINISKTCHISTLLAKLLSVRNINTQAQANKYLYGKLTDFCQPNIFPDMERVVSRIKTAITNKEKILVYGDYDCDGVGAISIFYLAMRDIGVNIDYYIPTRATEGYGLNSSALDTIKEINAPDLIITVDCGINSVFEVSYAKKLGMDIIVTDHHQPSDFLPDCLIINPFLAPSATPFCGAGVVFTLVRALFGDNAAIKYLDICAISTIADIVPLIDDNRLIVKYGLEQIRRCKCRPGIKELMYISKIDLKMLSTNDVGFKLAPRINAAGRLKNAEIALKLFIEDDSTALHLLADQLTMLNIDRQTMNNQIFEDAIFSLQNYDFSKYKLIMLQGDWAEGVVGIVCAKLAEYFNMPAILLCNSNDSNVIKGSARSIPGVNLFELFDKNNQKLLTYGGHEMAAGLTMDASDFNSVLEQFNDYLIEHTNADIFEKTIYYDEELPISQINLATYAEIMLLEPFGHANPTPIFMDSEAKTRFKQIGTTQHIKARAQIGDIIAFDKLRYADLLGRSRFTFLYNIEKNVFNGRVTPQFMIKELQFNTCEFNNEDLIENFCRTFLPYPSCRPNTQKKESKFPKLYISYDKDNIQEFLLKRPNINLAIYSSARCETVDTLAIAPDKYFPYFYFGEIIFLDDVGSELKKRIELSGIPYKILSNKRPNISININILRQIYVFLLNNTGGHRKITSVKNLYYDFAKENKNPQEELSVFIVGCYILFELNLLNVSKDGIISIKNTKVDVASSALLKYLG